MVNYIIHNVNVYHGDGKLETDVDVAVKDGRIVQTGHKLVRDTAEQLIDGTGKMLVPGFLDMHMHIDKAFTMVNDATLSLIGACSNSERWSDSYYGKSDQEIYDEIMEHSSRIVEMGVVHGTTLMRTNVLFTPTWRTIALDVMCDLKEKYKDVIDIQSCVAFPDEYRTELKEAAAKGKIDCIGGYPHLTPDHKAVTEDCFNLAKEYGLPVDLHCDESDVTNLDCFQNIINSTARYHMEGLVTCGHVTGLNATNMDETMVEKIIEEAANVKMNVTSLTSCNMYLMNMTRRGPSRVRQLTEAGVNVSVASDNVRDTFRPFGNCNLLEEALLTAQVHKFGTTPWLRTTMDMISYHPAVTALYKDYGLKENCIADFSMLSEPTPEEAVLSKATCELVFKKGKIVAKNGVLL